MSEELARILEAISISALVFAGALTVYRCRARKQRYRTVALGDFKFPAGFATQALSPHAKLARTTREAWDYTLAQLPPGTSDPERALICAMAKQQGITTAKSAQECLEAIVEARRASWMHDGTGNVVWYGDVNPDEYPSLP